MDKLPNLKEEDVEKTIKVPEHSGTRVPEKSQAASLRLRSWEHDPRGLRPGDSRTNVHHGMPWKAMERCKPFQLLRNHVLTAQCDKV